MRRVSVRVVCVGEGEGRELDNVTYHTNNNTISDIDSRQIEFIKRFK